MTIVHEIREAAFGDHTLMWGLEPAASALLAAERFGARGVREVLVPGIGCGRNALPFLERDLSVTGLEISETAIALARSRLALMLPIHHGSVTAMTFDARRASLRRDLLSRFAVLVRVRSSCAIAQDSGGDHVHVRES